jgi:hypothetical protein
MSLKLDEHSSLRKSHRRLFLPLYGHSFGVKTCLHCLLEGLEGFGGALTSGACEKNTEVTKYTKTRLDLPFESANGLSDIKKRY